jgi:hypothetical protein
MGKPISNLTVSMQDKSTYQLKMLADGKSAPIMGVIIHIQRSAIYSS